MTSKNKSLVKISEPLTDPDVLRDKYRNILRHHVDKNDLNKKENKIANLIYYNDLNAVRQRISDWVAGRLIARHAFVPDWTDLIRVFDYVFIDAHVFGIINGIKQKIKGKEFVIKNLSNEIEPELTKHLETKWFSRYQDFFVESLFYPYSLVELGEYINGKFDNIKMIKREYVVPQWRSVKMFLYGTTVPKYQTHFPQTGTRLGDITEDPSSYLLDYFEGEERINDYIFMECPLHDLGLLDIAAPHALGKMGSYSLFLDYLQKFVIPFRHGRTELNDPRRKDNMINMMEDWAGSGYAVTDLQDEIELLSQSGTSIAPFSELFKYSNNEISKAFASAVGIFDEKNFVGSAEAGERMLDKLVQAYCEELIYNVNDELIPRLSQRDTRYVGKSFEFVNKEVIPYTERVDAIIKLTQAGFNLNPEEVSEKVDMEIIVPEVLEGEELAEADKIRQESQSRLKGTVGGVQGVLQIQSSVAQSITQYDAGIVMLMEFYGVDEELAKRILGDEGKIKETMMEKKQVEEEMRKIQQQQTQQEDEDQESSEEEQEDEGNDATNVIYPKEMVENVERALKYAKVAKFDLNKYQDLTIVANSIINGEKLSSKNIDWISKAKIINEPYTKNVSAVWMDMLGGQAGKEWANKQLKKLK